MYKIRMDTDNWKKKDISRQSQAGIGRMKLTVVSGAGLET